MHNATILSLRHITSTEMCMHGIVDVLFKLEVCACVLPIQVPMQLKLNVKADRYSTTDSQDICLYSRSLLCQLIAAVHHEISR